MLYLTKQIGTTLLGIWKIEEPKEGLLLMLKHHDWLKDILSIKSDKILLEKLAVRVLLKELLGEEKQICYHASGRPYLADQSFYLSISHTRGYAAIAINASMPIGLDIEQISEKIRRVQSRVVSEKEYINPEKELEHLLLHWSAKEAVFKMIDTDSVDYLKHICVHPFEPEQESLFLVSESKSATKQIFDAYYQVSNDFVLALVANKLK